MSEEESSARVAAVVAIADPVERLRAAGVLRREVSAELEALHGVVAGALEEAMAAGVSQSELARELGVSRQRLWQLAQQPRS